MRIQLLITALAVQLATSGAVAARDLQNAEDTRCSTWAEVQRTVRYDYRLMNSGSEPATDIDVHVPLPRQSPRQEIGYLHLPDRKHERIFNDKHGQRIVHYKVERLEPGDYVDLGYVVGITLKNIHWNADKSGQPVTAPILTAEERQRYLTAETNYSMDSPLMRETAASLIEGTTSDLEKLTRIHDHVCRSIRYVRDGTWDPAATVLARGTGSCSEYNYVLSGLCRLAGMPTRCVGGSSNGFRDLPTTDTVYHRWTEVFLEGFGWFPADCSRDANPIRGKRSHFGRVYVDALVWCQQAGGKNDTLGWDYRAKAHVRGKSAKIRESHRTRWFLYQPEEEVKQGYAWFREGGGDVPAGDVLECALLHWHDVPLENRLRMTRALADAGRNACLRRAGTLPEDDQVRESCVQQLCESPELANTLLEKSRDLYEFRTWFRSNESALVPAGEGRFRLAEGSPGGKTATTTAPSTEIWPTLISQAVGQFVESLESPAGKSVAVMPVADQTLAGLGPMGDSILAGIKEEMADGKDLRIVDEQRFDDWMSRVGPGSGEYWILANSKLPDRNGDVVPDIIVVPVCITSESDDRVRYQLGLKILDLHRCKYTSKTARIDRKADEPASERGVLIGGGDTVLARWEHDMVSRHGHDWPLAGVGDVLSAADAALCNLECCVSLRGRPADKGERCPFYYRARPEMLRCLTNAGIDLVTAANNHGGDYGPQSVVDTVAWCDEAGLVCLGIGENAAAAEAPRLARVGPVRVAFAGMDTTKPCFRAGEDRPGSNHAAEEKDLKVFTEKVERLGRWADGRCDLLILTIHWGSNWVRETQPIHRKMARVAFENGVDAILGHSAHRLQGIEILDGKPVVYDMGNLLFDCELKTEGRRSALFRLQLSKDGVHRIEVLPVQALNGHTVMANYEEATRTLQEMTDLCAALGTELAMDEDIAGRPMGVVHVPNPKATARRAPAPDVPCMSFPVEVSAIQPRVDDHLLNTKIPADAHKLDPPASLAPGVELVAYRVPTTVREDGILRLSTWWRATGPVASNVMPAFHLAPRGGDTPRRGTPWYTRHDGGDWTVPLSRLESGTIVEDLYPARLAGLPPGPCDVFAVLIDTSKPEADRILGRQSLGSVQISPRVD